MLLVQKR